MRLEKIISLANKKSEMRFLAMVRSLRAVGCNLPIWVIPYDNNKFDLPDNCIWWEIKEVIDWLSANNAHKMMKKYQCLLTSNYQYADSDIVFLRNPEEALVEMSGFVTSCGHWRSPAHTYIPSTLKLYQNKSTTWQKSIFNAGQYACDDALFTFDTLKQAAEDPLYKDICLTHKTYDQVALNLLIFLSGVTVNNMTMQPYRMESTWAGDYTDKDYRCYWTDKSKMPYIIHWAGCKMNMGRPIDQLFLNYLDDNETQEWDRQLQEEKKKNTLYKKTRRVLSIIKQKIKLR